MAHYGELLDVYESGSDILYGYFDSYLNHPKMEKIKNVGDLSMYMAKTYCLLSNECRYIIAFTAQDYYPVKTQRSLAELSWVSLQTRTLSDNHDLPPHHYQPKAAGPLKQPIVRTNVTEKCSTYRCEGLPIIVTLLHRKSNMSDYTLEYQEQGNLISALETYQTIITHKGDN